MATWDVTSKAVAGLDLNTPLDANDIGKGVVFVDTTGAVSFSRVKSVSSATACVLHAWNTLPTVNRIVNNFILLDLGERHNFQDYMDEIDSKIKDDATKVSLDDRRKALRAAVTRYGEHKQLKVKVEVTGNGTESYLLSTILGAYWVHGHTQISSVEYPANLRPPAMLESADWEIFDDGTAQDGSNLKFRFIAASPAASEKFRLEVSVQLNLPAVGAQNFPDTDEHFENITTLASAWCCLKLAAAYAPSKDSSLSADVVNYNDKSRKYTDLARQYFKAYNRAVFGSDEPSTEVEAAFVDIDIDTQLSEGQGDFLHHRSRFR